MPARSLTSPVSGITERSRKAFISARFTTFILL